MLQLLSDTIWERNIVLETHQYHGFTCHNCSNQVYWNRRCKQGVAEPVWFSNYFVPLTAIFIQLLSELPLSCSPNHSEKYRNRNK